MNYLYGGKDDLECESISSDEDFSDLDGDCKMNQPKQDAQEGFKVLQSYAELV